MNYLKPTYHLCIFALAVLLNSQLVWGQNKDSLLHVAMLSVYDQPEKTIEIGNLLLEEYRSQPEIQIQVLQIMTNAYSSIRDYDKSLESILQAKDISQKLDNPILQYQVLVKIANQYHSLGVNTKALEILEEADRVIAPVPMTDSLRFGVGSNYAIRGFIYRDQLSCDIAIDYLNKAYAFYASGTDSAKVHTNQSVVLYNKGNCFITLNQLDSAKVNFKKSENFAVRVKANSLRAYSLKGLAEVYTLESNYPEAINVLTTAEEEAKSVGDLILNRAIYQGLADNNLALNNWKEFQDYNKKFIQASNAIKQNERQTINKLLEQSHDEANQQTKIMTRYYGIGIFGLSLILIGLLVWIIREEIQFQKRYKKLKSEIRF
ncbi:MAG: hypothetical protein WDA08_04630 [Weeksellaceae bacterium]